MIKKEAVKGRPGSADKPDGNYKAQAHPFDGIAISFPHSPQCTPVTREKPPSERTVLNRMNDLPLRAVKYRSRPSQHLQSGHTHTKRQTPKQHSEIIPFVLTLFLIIGCGEPVLRTVRASSHRGNRPQRLRGLRFNRRLRSIRRYYSGSIGCNKRVSIYIFFFPVPPHVLMNFRGFPPGCGDSVADF